MYVVAGLAVALWVAGLAAVAYGVSTHQVPFTLDLVSGSLMAAVAAAPLGFILAAAYVANQGRRLAAEARRSQRLNETLLGPAASAAAEAGTMVEVMRGQIEAAAEASIQAHETLLALREALAMETERLVEASSSAQRTAKGLTDMLGRERVEMTQLAVTLDARSASVADAIGRQAQMVKDAADLAEAQLREGQVVLAGGAADLAAAAAEAADAARTAGGELSRQVGRLETAGTAVGEVMRAAEEGLTQQRAALVTVAHGLRSDQEDFAALAESRTAQLAEFLTNARQDVSALGEVAALGAQSVSDLINKAADQFRDLSEAAQRERDVFVNSTGQSLEALVAAGAEQREALAQQMQETTSTLAAAAAEAREAAEVHAEAARARVDQLNEAAFAAGQKAEQVFDARLDEARRLIDQSARIVDDAGAETANRLEQGVAQIRGSLEELQRMMSEVNARAEALPQEAEQHAQSVRATMEQGMERLLSTARQAAEETQAIDQAFQERVRRNYEMLSEAVQLMGVVAGAAGAAAPALSRPGPLPRMPRPEAAPAAPEPSEPPPAAETPLPPTATAAPAAPPEPAPVPDLSPPPIDMGHLGTAGDAGLRPRLKLTPTATDQEFKAVFEAAGGRSVIDPNPADEGWTWKELLGGLDSEPEGGGGAEALASEIEAMGIDPSALLPRARVEEIAAAVQTGDSIGAREVVRALAPAAIRRLSRRLLTDGVFGQRAQSYVRTFAQSLAETAARDRQGYAVATELATTAGRAYLLLDAAVGDRP